MSSADNLCKQFGPKSRPTECWSWSESKLFGTLIVLLKEFFFLNILKKVSRRQQKHEKLTIMQRVKSLGVVKEMEKPGDYIMMVLFGNYKNVLSRILYFQIFNQYLHLIYDKCSKIQMLFSYCTVLNVGYQGSGYEQFRHMHRLFWTFIVYAWSDISSSEDPFVFRIELCLFCFYHKHQCSV